jgi:very-short-patch-repair endonuclease
MSKKLSFEEVAKRVKDFNPDYEFIEQLSSTKFTFRYLPTGEIFTRRLNLFLKGEAHAPSISKEIRLKKFKSTNLEKYGFENPNQNKKVKDKVRATNLEKYGCEYASQNKEVKEKAKITNLEKYGCANVFQNEEIKKKIDLSRKKSGDIKLIDGKTLKNIATEKGIAHSSCRTLVNKGADIINYEKSDGSLPEQQLKSILEEIGVEFQREKWFNGNKVRVDFYLPKYNLVIEANGIYFHREEKVGQDYHFDRRVSLNKLGIDCLAFTCLEIKQNPTQVKYQILDFIQTGGKESYIYKDNGEVEVNLKYSKPDRLNVLGYNILKEWISFEVLVGNKVFDSGRQLWSK